MGDIFGPTWAGEPFRLWSGDHFFMMASVAVWTAALVFAGRRMGERARRVTRWVIAAVMAINIVMWHSWAIASERWWLREMVPLHLCSVLGPVAIWGLLTRNKVASNLVWLLGVAGALQALITPEVAPYGFPHYRVLNSWIGHGLIVTAGFWLVFVEQLRPTFRWVVRCFVLLNVYALVVYFINVALGSNYLFINHKPEFTSVLDLLPPWPTYLLVLEAVVAVVMLLFWLLGRRWGNVGARWQDEAHG